MATVTLGVATYSTSNVASYTTAAFTPAAGDLLLVSTTVTGSATDPPTVTGTGGLSFVHVKTATDNAAVDNQFYFVSTGFATATSQTVTTDFGADAGTNNVTCVMRVAGMTRSGADAIRQSANVNTHPSSTNVAISFASSCLTDNPTIASVIFDATVVAISAPTNWPSQHDQALGAPTATYQIVRRNSGFTGTTIDWALNRPTSCSILAVELDTSALPSGSGFFQLF